MKPRIIFLVGPTAVGKSEIAVHLAKKLNAEIISCDSMQIYKGMNIITSKPTVKLKKMVRHHLIDLVSPTQEYNVFKYRKHAIKKIREILKKGRTPLFVGGTGLYMSVVIDGIFRCPASEPKVRQRLYRQAEKFGTRYLYKKLKKIDPQASKKIHPNDLKRIVRALEVFQLTGQPISLLQKQRRGLDDKYDIKIFCLNMERGQLYRRIEERVDKMFSQGLIKEVKRLLKLKLSKTAQCAIGMKELKGYFEGVYDLEEAKHLIKRNSRLYAKRQLTWFRKDKRIQWVDIDEDETPSQVARRIWKYLL